MFVCQGVNPDVKYEVQYSSYVNVTSDGFMILKRVVKTESFALQVTDSQKCQLPSHKISSALFISCGFLSCQTFYRMQLRAVDSSTGEFGTAAVSVQVIPGKTFRKPTAQLLSSEKTHLEQQM